MAGVFTGLPNAVIAYLFGGRGIAIALFALAIVAAVFLAATMNRPPTGTETGMEGIALIVVPALWVGVCLWALAIYFALCLVKRLPSQRRLPARPSKNMQ